MRDIAEDVGEGIVDHLPPGASGFLELRQMAVLGTVDSDGRVWASVVTGQPGFIETVDDRTLKIAARASSERSAVPQSHEGRPRRSVRARLRRDAASARKRPRRNQARRNLYPYRRGLRQLPSLSAREIVHRRAKIIRRRISQPRRARRYLTAQQQQISRADTFFIATDNPERGADVSHKGGNPGFVRVVDEKHIAFPDYNGNSMFNTLGNLTVNPHAGLLFIDFDSGRTLQLTGRASIDWNADAHRANSRVRNEWSILNSSKSSTTRQASR